MKKLSMLVMALAAVAVLGAAVYAADAPAPAPKAPKAASVAKAAPAKKVEAKGTITTIDATASTFNLKGDAAAEMTFKASPKLLKGLKAGEVVTVGYKTLASGDNAAVYVKKEMKKKEAKKEAKKAAAKK